MNLKKSKASEENRSFFKFISPLNLCVKYSRRYEIYHPLSFNGGSLIEIIFSL